MFSKMLAMLDLYISIIHYGCLTQQTTLSLCGFDWSLRWGNPLVLPLQKPLQHVEARYTTVEFLTLQQLVHTSIITRSKPPSYQGSSNRKQTNVHETSAMAHCT